MRSWFSLPSAQELGKRRPALDGIRGLSVVVILIYHSMSEKITGGFLAVDTFFILSGYLITGILLREWSRWGAIDLLEFYKHRARRLFPAMFVTVAVVALVAPYWVTDAAKGALRSDALSTLFYYANWHFVMAGESYFGALGDPSPFRHMWTLAIEEQFYVFLPFAFIFLAYIFRNSRIGVRRGVALGLSVLVLISAGWMMHVYTPGMDPSRIHYGTDTRAYQLLAGGVLALLLDKNMRSWGAKHARIMLPIGWISLLGVGIWFFWPDERSPWVFYGGSFAFTAFILGLILVSEVLPLTFFSRLLGWRPLAWSGEISYGLYLWHWPVIVMLNERNTGIDNEWLLFALRTLISYALAVLSDRLVEQPIRQQKVQAFLGRRRTIAAWILSVPLIVGVVVYGTHGIKALPMGASGTRHSTSIGSGEKHVLVIGDSVGFGISFGFNQKKYPGVQVQGSTQIGCGTAWQRIVVQGVPEKTAQEECESQFAQWATAVQNFQPQVVVWSLGGWEVFDHYVDGKILRVGSPEYAAHLRSRLEKGRQAMGVGPQYVIPNVPCYQQPSFAPEGRDFAPERNDPARGKAVNQVLNEFAAAHDDVHIVDTAAKLCPQGKFTAVLNGKRVRDDGVHYTVPDGVNMFWDWLMPKIQPYFGQGPWAVK